MPALLVVMLELVAPVLQLYVTDAADEALMVTVLVFGWQLMPMLELLLTFKFGGTLVPTTGTVMDVLLQPVSVLVTVKLYDPFWLTCTLALLALPTMPGPDQV